MVSDWRSSTWGEEISLEYGKGLQEYRNEIGQYRVYGSNGPVGWTTKELALGPGVILGRKGAYRGVEYSKDPFFVIDTAYYVKIKTDLHMRWLYYAIKHYNLGEIDDGSPVPSTTRAAVYVSKLVIPPPSEQKAIAHVLGALDDRIELNRRMNETLEAMAQALFKSWFVDFDPVIDNALASGKEIPPEFSERSAVRAALGDKRQPLPTEIRTLFPDEFTESPKLGWIPKGWVVGVVGDILERLNVKKRYKKKDVADHGVVPVYEQGANLLLGYHNGVAEIEAALEAPAFIFGDHTCVTKLSCEPFSISENVIPLKGKKYPTIWVYYAIQGKQSFEEYRRHWMELVIKPIVLPSVELGEAYRVSVKDGLLKNMKLSHQQPVLSRIRDTLLPKLMSGEFRIPDAEKMVEELAL